MGFFGKARIQRGDTIKGISGEWRGQIGKALSDQYDSGFDDLLVDCDFGKGKITLPVDMVLLQHT